MKFKPDIIKDALKSMGDNTVTAYDVKRREIEETVIPKKYTKVLTEKEIRRAERIGLIAGILGILAVFVMVIWWLL